MASRLDRLLNNLVGRLGEFGIGRGTAAQQPVGPSYQDYSEDIYNSYKPLNPVPRQEYSFDRYEQPTVRFTSGMLGGEPIQVEQEPPPPPLPPRVPSRRSDEPPERMPNDLPRRTAGTVGEPLSYESVLQDIRPPVMDDYRSAFESPIDNSGLFTGDVLSMTRQPPAPTRQEFNPQRGSMERPTAPVPSMGTVIPDPSSLLEGQTMFGGQLGMPPPVESPTYGDQYENLKGKSIEEVRLELGNPRLDVNEKGDLVDPTYDRFGAVVSEVVVIPSFVKDGSSSSPAATLADQAIKDLTTEEQLDAYLDNLEKETEGFKTPEQPRK